MPKKKVILPMKMSALIKIALKDLKKVEKDPKYSVDMSNWHSSDNIVCAVEGTGQEISRKEICSVCFAGAVMAGSLNAKWAKEYEVDDFKGNEKQLEAIDDLRTGSVASAAKSLDLEGSEWQENDSLDYSKTNKYSKFNTNIPDYEWSEPKAFHDAMSKLETKLRKAGL